LFAWHDVLVPPEWRRHFFTPLWLGYILAMNGLALRQHGWAPLTHRTGWFLALFPVSAAFWWLFEHLNQFVGNWYYSGTEASGDWDYFIQATLPFSTVIPAVASTWAWLSRLPRLDTMRLPAVDGHVAALGWFALVAGLLALVCVGIWPDTLFPVLWVAPLLVLGAIQRLLLGETLFAPLQHGDWRPLLQPALAALICGFLWELWNFGSLAKWHYSIPTVRDRMRARHGPGRKVRRASRCLAARAVIVKMRHLQRVEERRSAPLQDCRRATPSGGSWTSAIGHPASPRP
jgi:hypothetical protein